MAGRRPKPTRTKQIQGNPGRRPLNEREPKIAPNIPDCPEHLDLVAREEWARITPELHGMRILSRIDRAALAAYCQAWSRWVDAEDNLRKFGTIIKTPKGYPIQNPYLAIANTAIDTMRRFLVEFGMTPSSRSRIIAGEQSEPREDDPWQALLAPVKAAKGVN
jgi:P27 family predicted phage terminase small subunit